MGKGKDKGKSKSKVFDDFSKGKAKGKDKGKDDKGKGKGKDVEKVTEFLASLPEKYLLPEEKSLLAALVEAVKENGPMRLSVVAQQGDVADRKAKLLVPRGGLSQWVSTRVAEDLSLVNDGIAGEPTLCLAGDEETLDNSAASSVYDQFFSELPEGEFLEAELELRGQVLGLAQKFNGRVKLSYLTSKENRDLQTARAKLLPKGTPLLEWIDRRMGGEVEIVTDPVSGAKIVRLPQNASEKEAATADKGPDAEEQREQAKLAREQKMKQFLDSLPQDELTSDERQLRSALAKAFRQMSPSGEPIRFSLICQGSEVRKAKAQLLDGNMSIGQWIDNRIGGEVIFDPSDNEAKFSLSATFVDDEEFAEGAAKVEGHGDDEEKEKGKGKGKGKGQGKYAGKSKEDWEAWREVAAAEMEAAADLAAQEEAEAEAEAMQRVKAVCSGPLDPVEEELKAALIDACAKRQGDLQRLADLLSGSESLSWAWKAAKNHWKSKHPDIQVSLAKWVEVRLRDDVKLTKEPFVRLTPQALNSGASQKRHREDDKEPGRFAKSWKASSKGGFSGKGGKGGKGGGQWFSGGNSTPISSRK